MSSLSISRSLIPNEHRRLRTHIPETNQLGDLSIKWRSLYEAGVTYVERGVYQRAAEKESGKLAVATTVEIASLINQTHLPQIPHGNNQLTAQVVDIDFFEEGPYSSIAYLLDSELIVDQREYITDVLDKLNGVNSEWGAFDPHVTLATIPRANRSDEVLDAFWSFAPQNLTFLNIIAEAS